MMTHLQKSFLGTVFTVLTTLFATTIGWGQIVFTEDFDYTIGQNLTDNGWTAHSGSGTQPIDVVSGLTFEGYVGSGIGGAANLDNNGEDVHRTFAEQTTGVIYTSFILQVTSTNNAGYFFHLGQGTIGSTFFSRVWVNATGTGIGIGNSTPDSYVSITPDVPTLVVLKYEISTKISSLYVFNSLPDTEPATADQTFTETANISNVGSVALRQYNANQRQIVDGIRVAKSWEDIFSGESTQVATPTITAAGEANGTDTYWNEAEITLATSTAGATIHYTTNGSDPTTSSTEYTAPFQITATTTIKAIAVADDLEDSNIAEKTITITTPYTATIPYTQAFDNTLGDWINYSASGTTAWAATANGALVNGFNNGAAEAWLVSPQFTADAVGLLLSFDHASQFTNGGDLQVRYSNDYAGFGNPNNATWEDATAITPVTSGSLTDFHIPASGATHIALVYTDASPWAQWTISNLSVDEAEDASAVPVITPPAEPLEGTVGTAFSYQIDASELPESYAIVNGDLPVGLDLNTTTGEISGNPEEAGSFTIEVTATNAVGTGDAAEIEIEIAKGEQTVTPPLADMTKYDTDAPFDLSEETDQGIAIAYTSSDEDVATVSGNTVTVVGTGTTTITATNDGNDDYEPFSDSFVLTVTEVSDEEIAYTTGFEAEEGFTAGTSYQTTIVSGAEGQQWTTYYGTPSTTAPIAGGQSMQMRLYPDGNMGYTHTNFDLNDVTKVEFLAAWGQSALNVEVSYSVDGGDTWIGSEIFTLTNTAELYTYTVSESGAFENVRIRFQVAGDAPATGHKRLYIDNVVVYADSEISIDPVLSATPETIEDLDYPAGEGPSAEQSFVLSGANLDGTEDVTLSVDEDFEISLDATSGYTDEIILEDYDGEETTVYARLKAGLTVGTYDGVVAINGYDVETEVNLSGTVLAVPVVTEAAFEGTVGAEFNEQIEATDNPTLYTIVSGTLPAGLSLDEEIGIISGTPEEAGSFTIEVTATNAVGTGDAAEIEIEIAKGEQTVTPELADIAKYDTDAPFDLSEETDQGIAIAYTSSDEDVATVSGNTVTIVGLGTTTITATNTGNDNYEPFSDSFELTVNEVPSGGYDGEGVFEKILSLDQMTDGYYVVAYEGDFAMNNTTTHSYLHQTEITENNDEVINPDVSIVWKVETVDGNKTIYNEIIDNYIAYSGSGTGISFVDEVTDDNGYWTVVQNSGLLNDGLFVFQNVSTTNRGLIYSIVNTRFAAYAQSNWTHSDYSRLTLYRMTGEVSTEPLLSVSPSSLSGLDYEEENGPSEAQTFNVSGANLDGTDVVVSLPGTSDFEISADGTSYDDLVTLTDFDGTTTAISVRLKAGLATGDYNDTITVSGGGADDREVSVSGSVTGGSGSDDCGTEDFTNSNLTTTYADGSFVGNNGVMWTYVHSRDEGDYPISGNGIMLRRTDESSSLSASLSGGIADFSVDTRKAFTGNAQRRLELVINGEVIAQFEPEFGEGEDATVHTFEVNNINIAGDIDLELRLFGATGNQQIVLDNIVWTCYSSTEPLLSVSPSSLSGLDYVEENGPSAAQTFNVSGTNLDGTDVVVSLPGTSDFEISADGTAYDDSVTLTDFDGTTTSISVRLKAGLAVGSYDDTITVSGGGADDREVTVSGSVTGGSGSDDCGTEDFTNSNLTTTYADGSFVGNNGVMWTYVHSRDEGDYPISGNGIMLRRTDESSSLSASFSGGIADFSVDTRKAFTGNAQRRLELVINGEVIAQFEPEFGEGEDATVHTFEVNNINITGNIDLELRLFGATGNQQIVLDNIVWTCYSSTEPLLSVSPSSLSGLDYEEENGPSEAQTFNVSGTNLDGTNVVVSLLGASDFEISADGTAYDDTVTLTGFDGTTTSISVRLKAGLAVGSYDDTITVSGGGADDREVTVSGSVTEDAGSEDCGTEDFTNSNLTTTYADGSFVGNNGITWTYVHSRDEGDYPISGNGIMLRRADEPSSLSASFSGGIADFSVDTRKAFTGNAQRRLELVINGEVIAQFEPEFGEGEDATVHTFEVNNINIAGDIDLELRLFGAVGNQQIVLDNIVWTCYSSTSVEDHFGQSFMLCPNPSSVEFFITTNLHGENVNITLANVLGQQVYANTHKVSTDGRVHVQTEVLRSGVYVVTLTNKNGKTFVTRWIKK